MLRILLILTLQSPELLDGASDDASEEGASDDASKEGDVASTRSGASEDEDAIERRILCATLKNLLGLGDRIAERMIGNADTEREFSGAVLGLHDDEEFAEFLGGFMLSSVRVADRPAVLEATPDVPLPRSEVTKRLVEELKPLQSVVEHAQELLRGDLKEALQTVLSIADPASFGRDYMRLIYDPAASRAMTNVGRSIVRILARCLVARHVEQRGTDLSDAYVESLFHKSEEDVASVVGFLAAALGQKPRPGVPNFYLQEDRFWYDAKSVLMRYTRKVIDRKPGLWDATFPPPDDVTPD